MPARIVLETGEDAKGLFQTLCSEVNKQGAQAKVEIQDDGYVVCEAQKTEEEGKIKQAVINAAYDYIVSHFENQQIGRIIKNGYSVFTPSEKQELIREVEQNIQDGDSLQNKLFEIRRKKIIQNALERYFQSGNQLNIEGFLPFRLKEYYAELEDLIDYTADSFLMQKEYEEFIELLKYFVSMEPSTIDLIHIVAVDKLEYVLLDKEGNFMPQQLDEELKREMLLDENFMINKDDLLLSMLISRCPQKIVLHNSKIIKKELMDTIQRVFEGRVELCTGCRFCSYGTQGYLN